MPLPVLSLARAAVVAGQEGAANAYPGPGPWDARAWAGAVLYVLLFLAALGGILALLKNPAAEDAVGEEKAGSPPPGDPR